ncbi:MAG TPA: 6-phosphofructokinase [Anaerolineales bacterium]|nr:6-phosphofructokinase [Anaerolineales bacterium]
MKRIAVLTSGGDAPGMNAAVRAVVRTALDRGAEIYAIYEGYKGLVDGGERIRKMEWDSVGGILHQGGTIIGTARCDEFRTREGRRQAALNLMGHGIDGLIVIGGDGSLTGADIFRREWPSLLAELVQSGELSREKTDAHQNLLIVGMVGSIDNDFSGTEMTIGADSALHRITDAVDAITSTAASHQRTFIVKVMGRNCGYLALYGALATGADWVLIPEAPPDVDNWQEVMLERLKAGTRAGRRDHIVIMAEGAQDRYGNYIGSSDVQRVLEEGLGEEVRTTVLGHVQRGGRPSAYDRNLATLLGHEAVIAILEARPDDEPVVIGTRANRIIRIPLMESVQKTRQVAEAIKAHDYERAMALRSSSFNDAFRTLKTMVRALPHPPAEGQKRFRIAVFNAGAPAPGMNTAARVAVRLGLDNGHTMLGVNNGFEGLAEGEVREMEWTSVSGWASQGGSVLGTSRKVPKGKDMYAIARTIENHKIDAMLVIGGWNAYEGVYAMLNERQNYPAFNIPIVCLPASINNNLPGSEFSIGADTALNNIVDAVDKIKQSAVATRRCFVVEVMGHWCGYLALMSGLATGAEHFYLPEDGITLNELQADVESLKRGFNMGKRLGLVIRNEYANTIYSTSFICSLFEEEGKDVFDVRPAILGHLQQGGDPSPFDRIQASRLARLCIERLIQQCSQGDTTGCFIGLQDGKFIFHDMRDFDRMGDLQFQRPRQQWWLSLKPIAHTMAKLSNED